MADIFRKKSLDKLSSPEQLDKMIIINSPMTWLALAGGVFIILVALIWGVLGRVPITENGSGILISDGIVNSIYAGTQGVITKAHVSSGDSVKAGDVLYEVSSQEASQMIEQLEDRIAKVEKVTFDSKNDEVSSDNQTLISIKNQTLTLSLESDGTKTGLSKLKEEYEKQRAETDRLKQVLDTAESEYYGTLSSDSSASAEYEYSTAASEYQAAETTYQTAASGYQKAASTAADYQSKWSEAEDMYESLKNTEPSAAQEYYNTAQKYKAYYEEAQAQANSYASQMSQAEADRNTKKTVYENAKATYTDYVNNAGNSSSLATQKGNAYSKALSEYTTAKSLLKSLEQEVASSEVSLTVGNNSEETQGKTLKAQFDAAKASVLDELNLQLKNYKLLTDGAQIKASVDGVVYSTFVTNGSTVTVDMEVARISEREEGTTYQAVYFMPLAEGKNVKEGMSVNIYSSSLSKEEYGHMRGTVVSVASYVTSYADMYTRLGDTTLAETFGKAGAVLEVVCDIQKDDSTVSGYAWSSAKGRKEELTEGTLLEGSVITEKVAPITMLIPKLKEKFNL